MNNILLVFGVAMIATAFGNESNRCKCGEGLEFRTDKDGNIKCFGKKNFIVLPCNLAYRPECVCTGSVTGIVTDNTGTYCYHMENGVLKKQWDCENKGDWDKFFQEHPEQKKH